MAKLSTEDLLDAFKEMTLIELSEFKDESGSYPGLDDGLVDGSGPGPAIAGALD